MIVRVGTVETLGTGAGPVGLPVHSTDDGPRYAVAPEPLGLGLSDALDATWCKRHGFTGGVGQSLLFRPGPVGSDPEREIVLVGVGAADAFAGDKGAESLRRAAAAFVRAAGGGSSASLVVAQVAGLSYERTTEAAAGGSVLASYRFDRYRSEDAPEALDELVLVGPDDDQTAASEAGASRGARIAESVCLARDLVNEPPSSMTPERFAKTFLQRFEGAPGVTVEVWDEGRIEEEHLGGLLGVARGSTEPPRLVRVEYDPADPIEIDGRVPHVAIVGKGITFDSGGLSLKTASGMETMKTDMGGAAAVLSALDAAVALGARIRITAIAPLTENMPGGSATKPGDVLTARNGKTIEVLNTDAEGRLVLSDALSLAAESEPDAIIDLATLTGAAVVALGKEIAGLMGNDDALLGRVRTAGDQAGEPLWPLPLPDDYRSHIESEIADMRNVGRPGQAGSTAAALLLREFVGDVPWAHLDIAGPARSDENSRYFAKGGTGFGVRTLVELLTSEEFARSLGTPGST